VAKKIRQKAFSLFRSKHSRDRTLLGSKSFSRRVNPTEPTVYRNRKSFTCCFPSEVGELSAPALHLTSQTSSQLGTIAPGPAIGAVIKRGKWKYGLFNQNFLSDTFAETELQPILAYTFDTRWSAEIGDAQYTYDWKKDRLTVIPLSGQVNRIVSINRQSVHFFSEPSTT
jgi:hypothetical protein